MAKIPWVRNTHWELTKAEHLPKIEQTKTEEDRGRQARLRGDPTPAQNADPTQRSDARGRQRKTVDRRGGYGEDKGWIGERK